jgi:hypothetical protein
MKRDSSVEVKKIWLLSVNSRIFGCGNAGLLWLENATSSPGVSLHYKEMIQRSTT